MSRQDENENKSKRIKTKEERERARLKRIWSREQALEGLKKVYQVSIEGTLQRTTDKKSGDVEVKFNASAASAATKAIEAANKMLGYQELDTDNDADDTVEVEFYIDEPELCE